VTIVLVHIHHPTAALWNYPGAQAERLRARAASLGVRLVVAPDEVPLAAGLEEADVLFGRGLDAESLPRARRLAWNQAHTVGVLGLLFPELVESPVVVTNTRGVLAVPMAEHLLGLLLALTRKLHLARDAQLRGHWSQEELAGQDPPLDELAGKTLGVVGLGGVGTALAARASALGMRVLGVRRHPGGPPPPGVDEVRGEDELNWLLTESAVVANCLPHTPRTRDFFGPAQFARMRPGAYFLNVGRGSTVDEAALAFALVNGHLAGAGLDVTAEEPLPPESPLWSLPQVLLTPHVAGFSPRFWESITDFFAHNLERFLDGRPLLNVVDKRAGY
jgi:phosphoglycerate dehydrogenase-like enzyme